MPVSRNWFSAKSAIVRRRCRSRNRVDVRARGARCLGPFNHEARNTSTRSCPRLFEWRSALTRCRACAYWSLVARSGLARSRVPVNQTLFENRPSAGPMARPCAWGALSTRRVISPTSTTTRATRACGRRTIAAGTVTSTTARAAWRSSPPPRRSGRRRVSTPASMARAGRWSLYCIGFYAALRPQRRRRLRRCRASSTSLPGSSTGASEGTSPVERTPRDRSQPRGRAASAHRHQR